MEQAEQISQAVDQLSAAAEEMAENVQNISDRMDEIGAAVNDISASAGQLQKDSEEMQDNSRKAGEGMEKIMTGSSRSVESVDTITSKIHETNDYIEKIDEAVALILDVYKRQGYQCGRGHRYCRQCDPAGTVRYQFQTRYLTGSHYRSFSDRLCGGNALRRI